MASRAIGTTGDESAKTSATPASSDVSETSPRDLATRCRWCASRLERRQGQIYCGVRCRQSAWRLRGRSGTSAGPGETGGLTFAYADPPYPGLAAKYYRDEPTFAGEVDHAELIASLGAGGYAGWALSTSSKALRDVLPLCPEGARVCAWVKPIGVSGETYGLHSTWEAVVVVGGRKRRPGVRDWLRAMPARGGWGGDLMGRKPIAFCAWLFDCLGMVPGDELVDLYPGTGIVAQAWEELSSRGATRREEASPADHRRVVMASLVDAETPGPGRRGVADVDRNGGSR